MFVFVLIVSLFLMLLPQFNSNEIVRNSNDNNVIPNGILHRERRQLLFPYSTVLQLNIGVATPTPIATIFYNWAFQANFQLPWNRSQIPVDVLYANSGYEGESKRKKRDVKSENKIDFQTEFDDILADKDIIMDEHLENNSKQSQSENVYDNDCRLYHFYRYVEDVLNGYGYNGPSCVQRLLCQIAAEPLYSDDEEDLLHELASFVLNPTHDVSAEAIQSDDDSALPYVAAHRRGLKSVDCHKTFDGCSLPLLDMFSAPY